jgi:four helix bundle protein
MGYKSFEDLPVWNAAIELAADVFALTSSGAVDRLSGLKDQIERAVVSVSNNVAEGFERGTHEELLTFLYYARGSVGEVRSMLLLLRRVTGEEEPGSRLERLLPMTLSVSRQLGAWIESLKNSDRRGPRFENDATRRNVVNLQRAKAYREELQRLVEQTRQTGPPQDEKP